MGLDMYLYRVPRGTPDAGKHIDSVFNEFGFEQFEAFREKVEAAYWRKANAIHRWFVNKVQDGVDECQFSRPVAKAELEELKETCDKVLANKRLAKKLLPPQRGFFFGETDEWYLEDLKNTSEALDKILASHDFDKEDLVYHSSW